MHFGNNFQEKVAVQLIISLSLRVNLKTTSYFKLLFNLSL